MPEDSYKTILVTGGAGFIGSNYLNKYVRLHPETLFVNVDSLTYAGNLSNVEVSNCNNYAFEKVDICDISSINEIFKKYKPDAIIHFAAESHVDRSISDPSIFVKTNILGTHNLLMLAKENDIRRFLYISTDEVYGSLSLNETAWTEESSLNPRSPYSASKASGELLTKSYGETFGLNTVITRSSNNYGPYQDKSKLIPLFITKLLKDEKVPIYGKGENVRDWLYVEDNCDAVELVFRKGKKGETYNIGGGNELSNIELTKKLLEITGKKEDLIENVADRPGHDLRYAIDVSKIKEELGWNPKISFEEGLNKTVAHYRKLS